MNNPPQDSSQPLEPFLKKLFASLDLQFHTPSSPQPSFPSVEAYAIQFGKQLKPTSAIVVDGHPLIPAPPANDSRLEFQKKWLASPLTNHQLTSFDGHLIPGTGLYSIIVNGKVRFDESGRTRLGQSAELVQTEARTRPFWGPWFGFTVNMVVDQTVATTDEAEIINSFNYRIIVKPHDSVVAI